MPKKQLSEAERLQHALHLCRLLMWREQNLKGGMRYSNITRDTHLELAKKALTDDEFAALKDQAQPDNRALAGELKDARTADARRVSAFACAYALEEAYAKAGDDGADSVDWADVDLAREHGQSALGEGKVGQIKAACDASNGNENDLDDSRSPWPKEFK